MTNNELKTPSLPSSTALAPKESSARVEENEPLAKKDKERSSLQIPKDIASRLLPSIANADPDFVAFLLVQATETALPFTGAQPEWNCRFIEGAVRSIAPRDGLEAMLAVQMVRTHSLVLKYLELAASKGQTAVGIELFSNFANRLLRTFNAQVETLKMYRSKGEQKVEVKHVHVNRGGQAIVGAVNHTTGGGDDREG